MTARQRRTERRPGVHVVLRPRDEAILRGLARFRVARSADLVRLFFADVSRERGSQRLRQLFDGQFLQVRLGKLSEPNIYSLGESGRRWAQDYGLAVGRVPSGDLAHHLAVVESWSRLAAALRPPAELRLRVFRADWETREQSGGRWPVIPDGLIEVSRTGGEGGRACVALEVDLASERLEAVREKLLRYGQLQMVSPDLLGWSDFSLVVVLFKGAARRWQGLEELLRALWVGPSLVTWSQEWPSSFVAKLIDGTLPTDSSSGRKRLADSSPTGPTRTAQEEPGPSR